jgi:hypothetical protein
MRWVPSTVRIFSKGMGVFPGKGFASASGAAWSNEEATSVVMNVSVCFIVGTDSVFQVYGLAVMEDDRAGEAIKNSPR